MDVPWNACFGCEASGACAPGAGQSLPTIHSPQLPCGSGTCACLLETELLELHDGRVVLAREVVEGDQILSLNDGNLQVQTVANLIFADQPCIEVQHEGGQFVCSESHLLILAGGSSMGAAELDCEEHFLLGSDGLPKAIRNLRRVGRRAVVGWQCLPAHTFICAGIVHHNKAENVNS